MKSGLICCENGQFTWNIQEGDSMGKKKISEEIFPEIIRRYNSGGKTAAYDYLRSSYGIKNPYFVISRIRDCGKYTYDPDKDYFTETAASTSDGVFMDLDELCGTAMLPADHSGESFQDARPAAMEKLVHELISDRLLILSRYITLDSSARMILIDRTSLSTDGYQIVTH